MMPFFFTLIAGLLLGVQAERRCQDAVSVKPDFTNEDCRLKCEAEEPHLFLRDCGFVHYSVKSDHVEFGANDCYTHWIHGYEDQDPHGRAFDNLKVGEQVEATTAQECQLRCQMSSLCDAFTFNAAGNSERIGSCLLKPKRLLLGASRTNVLRNPTDDFCQLDRAGMCASGATDCLKCDDEVTCVWESRAHISGPKFCDVDSLNLCAVRKVSSYAPSLSCQFAVSTATGYTNDDCKSLCESDSKNFPKRCMLETFDLTPNGVALQGSCFTSYVYGHEDEAKDSVSGNVIGMTVDATSPHECQQQCQDSSTCAAFMWRASRDPQDGDVELFTCTLKSRQIVAAAINTVVRKKNLRRRHQAPDHLFDPSLCSLEKAIECLEGTLGCMECGGVRRCAWPSRNHISGPKYCQEHYGVCRSRLDTQLHKGMIANDDMKVVQP